MSVIVTRVEGTTCITKRQEAELLGVQEAHEAVELADGSIVCGQCFRETFPCDAYRIAVMILQGQSL